MILAETGVLWRSHPQHHKATLALSKEVEHWSLTTLRELHLGNLGLHDVIETDRVAVGAESAEVSGADLSLSTRC
jgi:hypothetical protein